MPTTVKNWESPIVETRDGIQVMRCAVEGHIWSRPATAGKPALTCPEHRDAKVKIRRTVEVTTADETTETADDETTTATDEGPIRHKNYDTARDVVRAGVPIMLVGPAGGGKTTAGRMIAEELGLEFYSESCSPMMTKYDLLGFVGPNGNVEPGILTAAVEYGGVVLLDEMDASNPGVLVTINMIAASKAGDIVTLPGKCENGKPRRISVHGDFRIMAGANTLGHGADDKYVGREQLDLATLDRFAVESWEYDERLERHLTTNDRWHDLVVKVRRAVESSGADMLVSPRASLNGAALLSSGIPWDKVCDLVLWNKVAPDTAATVKGAAGIR